VTRHKEPNVRLSYEALLPFVVLERGEAIDGQLVAEGEDEDAAVLAATAARHSRKVQIE
jgi:hypothetical protein